MSAFWGKADITFRGRYSGKADIAFCVADIKPQPRDQPQGVAETKGLGGLK